MRTVRFRYVRDYDTARCGYVCSEPGDRDGEYVPAEKALDLAVATERLLACLDTLSGYDFTISDDVEPAMTAARAALAGLDEGETGAVR